MNGPRKYWLKLREVNGDRPKTVVICDGPGAYDVKERLKPLGFKYGFTYDDYLLVCSKLPKETKVDSALIETYLGKQAKRWSLTLDGPPALNGAAITDIARNLNTPCPAIPGYDPNAAPAVSDDALDQEMPF
jgi:hypothetical protein